MLSVDVKYEDSGAAAMLARLRSLPRERGELHQAMAAGLEGKVRSHLQGINTRSPHTGFYGKAARSVESSADSDAGLVRVPHRGAALRFYGGRVQMKDRLLALPTKEVPVRGGERMRPGEMTDLAFVPNRKGGVSVTRGFLFEGERFTPQSGKHKGQARLRRKPGGKLLFVLRAWTDHEPDPTVLPGRDAMTAAARAAGEDWLAAMLAMQEGGAA